MIWRAACHALCATMLAAQSPARVEPSRADRAIAHGQLDDAEALLFEASRVSPRDPAPRRALGSFLAARGRLKVGVVLLEEAKQFGADARGVDEQLAHIHGWIGSWTNGGMTAAGRAHGGPLGARAAYLARHPSSLTGPDSTVVRLEPNELRGLGRIAVEVGNVKIQADIDAGLEGLLLPDTPELVSVVESFDGENGAQLSVAHSLTIGAFVIRNVPARLERGASARVGLDVVGRLMPTFDPAAGTLTLHSGTIPRARGDDLPILLTFPGVRIVTRRDEAPVPLESAAGRSALRRKRWTLDLREGVISLAR